MQNQREIVINQVIETLTRIEGLGFKPSTVYEHPEWQDIERAWITEPLNLEDMIPSITRLTKRFEDILKQSERVADERLAVKDLRSKWGHLVDHLPDSLQPKAGKFSQELLRPGTAYGLGCTNHVDHTGGLISIETVKIPGRGRLILSGGKEENTKESARIAMSCVAANAHRWGIKDVAFRRYDFHIHGPGEGSSAGVAIVMALVSLLTGRPLRTDVASTGTISLTGGVGSVGCIKGKILGAYWAGIKTVFLPKGNKHSLDDVPQIIKKNMELISIETMSEVLELCFKAEGSRFGNPDERVFS